jgi:hypothetical protein
MVEIDAIPGLFSANCDILPPKPRQEFSNTKPTPLHSFVNDELQCSMAMQNN